MTLVGASRTALAEPLQPSTTISNYFAGSDPGGWRAHVSQFQQLRYDEVYPGIDVLYYGAAGNLEHDFVVRPGADPGQIRLRFADVTPRLEASGDLLFDFPDGPFTLHKPVAYQHDEFSARTAVDSSYRILSNGDISLSLGNYNRSRPLVIDPVITYATTFGFLDLINAIAVDSAGMIYVTGQAYTPFGITTKNPLSAAGTGSYNVFVTKINPTTNSLVFSTYLGGNKSDEGFGIALDGSGNVFVTGTANSTNFPTLNAAQSAPGSSSAPTAFVTAMKGDGSALLYSTYLGGSTKEAGYSIAADANGNAYVTGLTGSSNFPTKNAIYATINGGASCSSCTDAFVTKYNLAGQVQYSTYLGGTGSDAAYGIAVDASGNAYVTGLASAGFPIKNAVTLAGTTIGNSTFGGVMITEINAAGSALVFSDSISSGTGSSIALDSTGAIYVAGTTTQPGQVAFTYTPGVPTSAGALNTTSGGSFVFKLAAGGAMMAYSTLLGGNATDFANGIAVDSSGNAWVAGYTTSPNFPTVSPVVGAGGGYFYASSNGGTSFVAANNGLLPLSVQLLFDPNNPATLTAAQFNSGSTTCTATKTSCGGLFTSTNAGSSWTRLTPTGLTDIRINQIARSKSTPTTIYVLTPSGFFKSTDNGTTYALATGAGIPTLTNPVFTIDPFVSTKLYLESNSNVLYISTDSGATWTGNTTSFPANRNVGPIVPDLVNSGVLYTTCNSLLWKSTDGGATWSSLTTTFSPSSIVVDPSTPTTLYATTTFTPFYKSTDGGVTWTQSPSSLFGIAGNLLIDPTNSQNLYFFSNPGITSKSTNGGTSFTSTKFSGLPSIDPTNNQNVYLATGSRVTGFLSELNPAGTALLFSTYAGGTYHSEYEGVALDLNGNAYVAGFTDAADAPNTNGGATPNDVTAPVSTAKDSGIARPNSANNTIDLSGASTGLGTTSGGVVVYPKASAPLLIAVGDVVSSPAIAGASITYTLTAGAANGTATSVVLTWTKSALTSIISASSATFTCTKTVTVVTCTQPSLTAGAQATDTIVAGVTKPGTVTDTVTLTAANASNSAIGSSTVTATASANLTATLFIPSTSYVAGAKVIGDLVITNSGPSPAYSPLLTVNATNATPTYVLCPHGFTVNGNSGSCVLDDIAPGSNGVRLAVVAAAGTNISNPGVIAVTVSASDSPTAADQQSFAVTPNTADLTNQIEAPHVVGYLPSGQFKMGVTFFNNGPGIATVPIGTVTISNGYVFSNVFNPAAVCPGGYSGLGTSTFTCNMPSLPSFNYNFDYVSLDVTGTQPTGTVTATETSLQTPDPVPGNNLTSANFDTANFTPQTRVLVNSSGSLIAHTVPGSLGLAKPSPAFSIPGSASGLTFDFAGHIWVAGATSAMQYDSRANLLATYSGGGLGGSGNTTAGIAIDGDGKVWIPNTNGTVTLLGNLGVPISPSTGFSDGLNAPTGIAIDNAGTVWVANSGNNTVTRIFGAAAPAVTPLSNANYTATFGARP